jgi:crossover junction endodeoxyribonuclease RuvC
MLITGVDPGAKGGLATIVRETGKLLRHMRMPTTLHRGKVRVDAAALSSFIDYSDMVIIEAVHAMPRQGVSSSFQFGRMFGAVEAAALALELPLTYVSPQAWKKHHGLTANKKASLDMAATLYPNTCDWSVLANDGVAEAALIAQWWINRGAALDG